MDKRKLKCKNCGHPIVETNTILKYRHKRFQTRGSWTGLECGKKLKNSDVKGKYGYYRCGCEKPQLEK